LAARLGWRLIDLDELVLADFDEQTVQAVWSRHGEAAWRSAEVRVLQRVMESEEGQFSEAGRVIALGGGVPLISEARAIIEQAAERGRAQVVYIETSIDVLRQRLSQDLGDRPSLTGDDPIDEIAAVMAEREPVYRSTARLAVTTDDRSADEVAAEIARRLDQSPG
jgi:shikimate kinase